MPMPGISSITLSAMSNVSPSATPNATPDAVDIIGMSMLPSAAMMLGGDGGLRCDEVGIDAAAAAADGDKILGEMSITASYVSSGVFWGEKE